MNKQFVLNTIKDFESWEVGQCVTFRYKSSNKVEYELTIKKEEPKYFPFIVTVTGTRTGTPETIGRRYTSVERAFLHIFNFFNENANEKDDYDSLEEALDKISLKIEFQKGEKQYGNL